MSKGNHLDHFIHLVYSLWKEGWHKVPELMIGGGVIILAFGLAGYNIHRYYKYDLGRIYWKKRYTVYREGDPRLERQIYPVTKKFPFIYGD